MRHNLHHVETDHAVVRRLIAENPWATIVSPGLVASHLPVLLEDRADELAVFSHLGRPDEKLHAFGEHEVLLIVAGPHGYISPSWYVEGDTAAPTWNFSVAHCYGTPEILDEQANLRMLARLVEHFEQHVEDPVMLDRGLGARLGQGTIGFRLPIERWVCKVKMSQDKQAQSQRQVLDALRREGRYRNDVLAADMERALGE